MTNGAEEIRVLEGLEAVRRRPGMYVGNLHDGSGLERLWLGCVLEQIEAHRRGEVRRLSVGCDGDWIEIASDERCTMRPIRTLGGHDLGPGLDVHFAHLTHTAGFARPVACALSRRLEVETRDGTRRWRTTYERGQRVEPIVEERWSGERGTRFRFRPDPVIFPSVTLDTAAMAARLDVLARLHPLLEITWQGRRIAHRDGLRGWVAEQLEAQAELGAVHHAIRVTAEHTLELALGWRAHGAPEIRSFVNDEETKGGAHHAGLFAGLVAAAEGATELSPEVLREQLSDGLVAVIAIRGRVDWAGSVRERVVSPAIEKLVREAVATTAGWDVRRRLAARR